MTLVSLTDADLYCAENGWWVVRTEDGWTPCDGKEEAATADLNRYILETGNKVDFGC
jgi:hypothetical protein